LVLFWTPFKTNTTGPGREQLLPSLPHRCFTDAGRLALLQLDKGIRPASCIQPPPPPPPDAFHALESPAARLTWFWCCACCCLPGPQDIPWAGHPDLREELGAAAPAAQQRGVPRHGGKFGSKPEGGTCRHIMEHRDIGCHKGGYCAEAAPFSTF
jgi:hypothetical protein